VRQRRAATKGAAPARTGPPGAAGKGTAAGPEPGGPPVPAEASGIPGALAGPVGVAAPAGEMGAAGPGPAAETAAGAPASPPAARPPLGPGMLPRIAAALAAREAARAEGRPHLCLTDPDARMMSEGREKHVRECHSWEVAVDREAGLLVVGQTTQEGNDTARREPLVAAAQAREPGGVTAVDGDSGFYAGDAIGRLLAAGLDLCVPDSNTACDLHRGQPVGTTRGGGRGRVLFEYDAAADLYRCPEGNALRPRPPPRVRGQTVTV
jgi:hypothetical protein